MYTHYAGNCGQYPSDLHRHDSHYNKGHCIALLCTALHWTVLRCNATKRDSTWKSYFPLEHSTKCAIRGASYSRIYSEPINWLLISSCPRDWLKDSYKHHVFKQEDLDAETRHSLVNSSNKCCTLLNEHCISLEHTNTVIPVSLNITYLLLKRVCFTFPSIQYWAIQTYLRLQLQWWTSLWAHSLHCLAPDMCEPCTVAPDTTVGGHGHCPLTTLGSKLQVRTHCWHHSNSGCGQRSGSRNLRPHITVTTSHHWGQRSGPMDQPTSELTSLHHWQPNITEVRGLASQVQVCWVDHSTFLLNSKSESLALVSAIPWHNMTCF